MAWSKERSVVQAEEELKMGLELRLDLKSCYTQSHDFP